MIPDQPYTPRSYSAAREALLERIRAGLEADPRVAAAWLLGSYGRGEQDAVSDIDLGVVVDTPFAAAFCAHSTVTGAFPAPGRMELFRKFGEPANIHENHNHAPAGGSFTSVLYRDPPVIVDWTILPRAQAMRPGATRLLFDRAGIPRLTADQIEAASGSRWAASPSLSERIAFFWMMAAVTAKTMVRGRVDDSQKLLSMLEEILAEIAQLASLPLFPSVKPSSPGKGPQPDRLRQLCDAAEALSQQAATAGGWRLVPPRRQIETILQIAMPGSPAK